MDTIRDVTSTLRNPFRQLAIEALLKREVNKAEQLERILLPGDKLPIFGRYYFVCLNIAVTSHGSMSPVSLSGVPFLVRVAPLEPDRFPVSNATGWAFEEANTTDDREVRNSREDRCDLVEERVRVRQFPSFRFLPFACRCYRRLRRSYMRHLMWETCNVFTDGDRNKNMTSRCDGIRLR